MTEFLAISSGPIITTKGIPFLSAYFICLSSLASGLGYMSALIRAFLSNSETERDFAYSSLLKMVTKTKDDVLLLGIRPN